MRALHFAALALLTVASASAQRAEDRSDFVVIVQTPDGEPIAGASVLVGDRGAAAGPDGEATIEGIGPGRYRVRVSFLGRQTRELAARLEAPGPWALIVEMAESVSEIANVVVEGRDLSRSRLAADGFFDRQRLGAGTILTIEDLEVRNVLTLGDALGGVLGVRVVRGGDGSRVAVSQSGGRQCTLAVYLDGAPSSYATQDLDTVPGQDIVAVEVYRRPSQVPAQYNQLGISDGCGVILAWTSFSMNDR